jgi:hypothetical protein
VGVECVADLWLAFDLRYPAEEILGNRQPLGTGVLSDGGVKVRWDVPDLQRGRHTLNVTCVTHARTATRACSAPGSTRSSSGQQ